MSVAKLSVVSLCHSWLTLLWKKMCTGDHESFDPRNFVLVKIHIKIVEIHTWETLLTFGEKQYLSLLRYEWILFSHKTSINQLPKISDCYISDMCILDIRYGKSIFRMILDKHFGQNNCQISFVLPFIDTFVQIW